MRRVLVATILCLYGGSVLAQSPATEELGNQVDAVAKQLLSRPTAGVSIAVARDGRVILARGYGMANVEHSVAVTPDTVFHIASISKNILAAVVLQLGRAINGRQVPCQVIRRRRPLGDRMMMCGVRRFRA